MPESRNEPECETLRDELYDQFQGRNRRRQIEVNSLLPDIQGIFLKQGLKNLFVIPILANKAFYWSIDCETTE